MTRAKAVTRALLLAIVLGCLAILPAAAQREIGESKLNAFARAAAAVGELGERWVPRIQNAGSEVEADKLRQEAQSEMLAAIKKTKGITVEEYRQIAQAVQKDPDLRIKLEGMLRDRSTN
jgi:GTP1/Obg family GTP-binding protein